MAARLFQSILLEIKNKVPFILGIVDNAGNIVSCTELRFIGENVEAAEDFFSSGSEEGEFGGYSFRRLDGYDNGAEYAVFAGESGQSAAIACNITAIAINNSKSLYDEKHDKATFIKKIILDNILPGDIYAKARELHFATDVSRVVFIVRVTSGGDISAYDVVSSLFPDKQKDFVFNISETDTVLVKEIRKGIDRTDMEKLAASIVDTLSGEHYIKAVVGIGTPIANVKDLATSFKEAQIAMEVSKVFDTEKQIIRYDNLGIARLIYQLPTTVCEMFLREVFKQGSIESLDQETLFTINKFFENNLNVSETSRKLFVHRNTLVYRLEKIKKLTGLDLRQFDHAIVFKVALMVRKYLSSREAR